MSENDKPKEVDFGKKSEMAAAIESLKRDLPYLIEMAIISAKNKKAHYDAYIVEGFDQDQALELCKYVSP